MFATLLMTLILALPAAPTGRCVLDQAGALTPAESSAIEAQCEAIDRSGAGQIAVVTTNNLEGLTRPQYAERLFKSWGIGHKGKDDGILLLIALPPADRGIKVEIGYGLEGAIPDGKAMAIVRDVGIPQFKAGHLGRGILNIIDGYTPLMRTEAATNALNVKVPARANPPATVGALAHDAIAIRIFVLLAIVAVLLIGFIWLAVWLTARRHAREDAELRAQKREQEQWNRDWASASKPAAVNRTYTPPVPPTPVTPTREPTTVVAPVIVVEEQPAYQSPYPVPERRHHRRSSSDDDSSSSSSSHSSSSDYGSSSSGSSDSGSFGGFGGGSSGGGGGDAGW